MVAFGVILQIEGKTFEIKIQLLGNLKWIESLIANQYQSSSKDNFSMNNSQKFVC
jgi:hypothetical protein